MKEINEKIEIISGFIKLEQLIKFSPIGVTGKEIKQMIKDGKTFVNGEECRMRGKKVYPGDLVSVLFDDTKINLEIVGN